MRPCASVSDEVERILERAGTKVKRDAMRYAIAHFRIAIATGDGGQ